MTPKRFRVAFSFAGEKREFVARIVRILSKYVDPSEILYDKLYEHEFAREDLKPYLWDLYRKQSDLVVAVLSRNYEENQWCALEWNAIWARFMEGESDSVMLCRFDLVNVKNLPRTPGFLELDDKPPEEAANLILSRLKQRTFRPSREMFELVKPCRFDLNTIADRSVDTIIRQNGLIGLAFCCHSFVLLKQCRDRIELQLGREELKVLDVFAINPLHRSVEKAVAFLVRHRKVLDDQDVLAAIQVPDEDSAKRFWASLKLSLSGKIKRKLIVLMAVSQDCALPEGTVHLETPLFRLGDAHTWILGVVRAMNWPRDFAEFWLASMIREIGPISDELDPDWVYLHLEETTKFIGMNSRVTDFEAELRKREQIYGAT